MGQASASHDPIYAYIRGKMDSKYMCYLASTWAMSETLLAYVNPNYKIQFAGNPVYARMALHRFLLGEIDHRAVMVQNRRAIDSNPQLQRLASGAQPDNSERQRGAGTDGPQTTQQKEAYTLQKFDILAQQSNGELEHSKVLEMTKADAVMSKIRFPGDVRAWFQRLHTDYAPTWACRRGGRVHLDRGRPHGRDCSLSAAWATRRSEDMSSHSTLHRQRWTAVQLPRQRPERAPRGVRRRSGGFLRERRVSLTSCNGDGDEHVPRTRLVQTVLAI